MAPYHHLMVHFPIALWTVAALIIILRALSDGTLARNATAVLVPLLVLGVISGVIAYAIGLSVFPFEAISSSPLGRNKLIAATWALAYWTLLAVTVWRLGESVWQGASRWVMLLLGLLGGGLLTVAGALGGHLSGSPSAVSQLFRLLGWEVYTTFYVPNFMLVLLIVVAAAMAAMGVADRKRA
ncbi:MAG: heme ABC transporter permease [Gammaproteobacteria bacterium]|nr:heme ABC transporter permease [Gammaproteobacteria bacterium]